MSPPPPHSEEEFDEIRSLFVRAIALDGEDRERFLAAACPKGTPLRVELDTLLAHDADGILPDAPLVDPREARLVLEASPEPSRPAEGGPRILGGFRILGVLGRGGTGIVYRAVQDELDREVALKVLPPELTSPDEIARLRREARLLGRLRHPGIARVLETGTAETCEGPRAYLAMELVEGRALDEHAEREDLSVHGRVELLTELARAVHHAHERGVIHRDLKPANVRVTPEGRPVVLDFGVARAADAAAARDSLATRPGLLVGTLPYMAPEQLDADESSVDARTDVFALGVIAYQLLAGRLPIDLGGAGLLESIRRLRTRRPRALGADDRRLRGDLAKIVHVAMARRPADRYPSALALARDLERFLAHLPILASPPSTVARASLFARRHRAPLAGFAAVALVLGASLAVSLSRTLRAGRETDRATELRVLLLDVLSSLDYRTTDGPIDLLPILLEARERLPRQLEGRPDEQRRVREMIEGHLARLEERASVDGE